MSPAVNLLLGAQAIALYLYGKAGRKEIRDVYRNPFGFSFFKHGNAIAALKSTIRAELHEAERAAQEERAAQAERAAQEALRQNQKKALEARVVVKARRRNAAA
jgi:hypothetical protein